ncbi:hypothetical protein DFP72DRAFT_1174274 [Ephemerocybe angulata]|uniref:Uncharacterized protein n=1 Tax=Ephemerocybe angulata TaxID=980116 RepID=A0A8H6M1M4_9AGAR|nr:hypothetical protein DFP72DRAFT_1174274 [Tulosesus angulatus]
MPSSLNCPDLPTELWNQILSLAAGANDSTEFRGIVDDTGLCCGLPALEHGSFRESFKTKRSMVLVNHEWNNMATPILYEHLPISRMVELKKLLETLTSEEDDGLSLGRFVKRLDITDSDVEAPNGISTSVAIELCPKMVNLVTCFVELKFNCNPDLLLAALGPQLRHLHVHENFPPAAPSISFDNLLEFLNLHPNLTSISFPFLITHQLLAKNSKTRRWPSIHKWTLQNRSQTSALGLHVPAGALPGLTEICFDQCYPHWNTFFWSEEMKGFLVAHGGSLLTIGLGLNGEHPNPGKLSGSFQHISDFCPRAKEVDIAILTHAERGSFTLWTVWLDQVIQMPQITTLGVRICSPRHNDEGIERLHCAVALPWPKIFPKLERIRVLQELDVDRYRMHDDVTRKYLRNFARWATRPIRVEDLSGTILGELSKELCTLVER